MSDNIQSDPEKELKKREFPEEKAERRLRARTRDNFSDRRTAPRFFADFPVTVHVVRDGKKVSYPAMARDVSDGGMLIESPEIPDDDARLEVEFRVPDGAMPEQFLHGKLSLGADVRIKKAEKKQIGVSFEKPISAKLGERTWYYFVRVALMIMIISTVMVALTKTESFYFFWFDVPVFLYNLVVGSYLVSRFIFAAFYKKPPKWDNVPTVTVVIPAYNEETHIERTVRDAMEASYPKDKIEIIAVNDCSTDNTIGALKRAQERYPDLIIIDFEENKGKREALAAGAKMGKGEVFIFLDSDSFVRPDAFINLVNGFADPMVGAISGECEVENKWANLLTKMQSVRYYIGFRVIKAAESIFNCITCVSGPLAAYRREVLFEYIEPWLDQTFLGQKATFGDDRSLTTFILKKYKVIYDSSAITTTIVPDSYKIFFKQQMRWKRSWLRESIRASAFMWKKQPLMAISFYMGLLLPIVGPAIVFRALFYLPIVHNISPVNYIVGVMIMGMMMSSAYMFAKRSRLWWYGLHFCFFYMFAIIWQLPWAMVTFYTPSWGTREISEDVRERV
ncbi:MAG: glycosyltransferase [Nitrospirae bacterium]|nr:glycosyltransferase [Nitrospirota bacterium]